MPDYIVVECMDYKGNNTMGKIGSKLIPITPITHTWNNKKE